MNLAFRLATTADYSEVQRITREAYLHAGHFTADHPYMSVLENVEHRAEHAEVWVAEASGVVVAAVTLTFAGQPYSEIAMEDELEFRMLAVDPAVQGGGIGRAVVRQVMEHAQSLPGISAISITSATFMEQAHALYGSLGFRRVPARDWYVPGEDVLLWVFRLELSRVELVETGPTRPVVEPAETRESGPAAGTYGRPIVLSAHPEASLRQRDAFEQKHAIARWAASVIRPGENIVLDAGSTVGALAHELRGFEKLSVTTPGINTMQELADSEGIGVDCLGGRLRSLSQSFVGPLARRRWSE